jgi:L-lysine 2,3-aminomutase
MMSMISKISPKKFKLYSRNNIHEIRELNDIPEYLLTKIKAVSTVLPFRTNNYVVDELIDWNNIPADPIFQLTFPQPGMLSRDDLEKISSLLKKGASEKSVLTAARKIQMHLNPHPASQMELNVPVEDGKALKGMQHKYRETILFFPSQGQTCHAYCTYCFRWPQFVGLEKLKFASNDIFSLINYLRHHREVTDVLFTGGDPLTMRASTLSAYIEPLLSDKPGNISTIRIGTKVPAYWPYRFLTDRDADDLLRLFERVIASGLHLAIMYHSTHSRELETVAGQAAIKRILGTGAGVRCQSPVIRHVNDEPEIWADMWRKQVNLGAIPYYMFIGRDTGPKDYFKMPLVKAYEIFTAAYGKVAGLGRTVRGPLMSATPGKILISGIVKLNNKKHFALQFIQGRDPKWVNRIFFAEYSENAYWLDDLRPSFGESQFFFEPAIREMQSKKRILTIEGNRFLDLHFESECA